MKVAGSAVIGIQRDRVWAALQDPAVLVRTIPGCERLEESGPDTYRMTVNAGVAAIKGVYHGEVGLSQPHAPESFVLRARGQGAPGTVEATVQVRLSEVDAGTRVDYDAEAVVGGMIGGVGQRMLGSVAKRTAGQFFSAVEQHLLNGAETTLTGAEPAPAPADASPAPSGTAPAASGMASAFPGTASTVSGTAPAASGMASAVPGTAPALSGTAAARVYERSPKRPAETRPWVMLASFGTGAGIALTGVAIGWLLGRAARR
ncbi:carbon monoxide dehydrogenase subunit G [Nonomuraea typhae]|uniref:Carbon monoxide dehydrogenase subunit G n=1 Tax=Nonomuraea typhae TaxID=2603600 RepID=A0ABW7YLZ9_9ACTN